MREKREISNLQELKQELFSIRTKLSCYKIFSENFGLSILETSKLEMYEFWYDFIKLKHGEKTKICYMDTVAL